MYKKIITDEDKDVGFIICGYSNKDESEDIPEVYEIQYPMENYKTQNS